MFIYKLWERSNKNTKKHQNTPWRSKNYSALTRWHIFFVTSKARTSSASESAFYSREITHNLKHIKLIKLWNLGKYMKFIVYFFSDFCVHMQLYCIFLEKYWIHCITEYFQKSIILAHLFPNWHLVPPHHKRLVQNKFTKKITLLFIDNLSLKFLFIIIQMTLNIFY